MTKIELLNQINSAKIYALEEVIRAQKLNCENSLYMCGIANGLICALSIFTDREPDYIPMCQEIKTPE